MPQREGTLRRLFTTTRNVVSVVAGSAVMLVTMLVPHRASSERARKSAEQIIAASRAFERKHGRLPTQLEELIPEFLPSIPRAKYDGPHFGFTYDVVLEPPRHVLGWTEHIPFGRPFYVFEEDRWGYLD